VTGKVSMAPHHHGMSFDYLPGLLNVNFDHDVLILVELVVF
jgi:hypothetical protein